MSNSDARAQGIAKFKEVMQFEPPTGLPPDPFLDTTFDHLFANLWSRPGLTIRDRRLITLTLLVSLGNELTLKLHFGAAMKSGDLTDEEIDELILHVAHYGGWPTAAVSATVVRQLRTERDAKKR